MNMLGVATPFSGWKGVAISKSLGTTALRGRREDPFSLKRKKKWKKNLAPPHLGNGKEYPSFLLRGEKGKTDHSVRGNYSSFFSS